MALEGTLPPVIAILTANTTDFMAKMGEAGAAMKGLQAEGGGRFSQLAAVGKTAFLALGTAAVAAGAISVDMASKFDSAMEMIHTQAGASQHEVDSLKSSVLGLAGKTAQAPLDLADALYHIESNGYRGATALSILKMAAEGAAVGHANLTDTTNALTAAVNSGIAGVQNYSQAMGALNAIVGAGDMKMQDLNDAFGTGIVVVAKQFGNSLNDVGSALATFGDNNIRGAKAGTELRMAIMDLADQSAKGQKILEGFGIKTGELGEDMRKGGLGMALTDLKDKLAKAGVTGSAVGDVLTQVFTKKSAAPLSILIDQLGRFDQKQQLIAQGANKFGEDFSATSKTFAFQLKSLEEGAKALGIQLGNVLIPVIVDVAHAVMDVVTWFEKHKTAAVALGAGIAAMLVPALAAATVEFGIMAVEVIAATWPLLAIGAAVAGLVYAGLWLADNWSKVWKDIKKWFDDAVAFLRSGFGTLVVMITGPLAPLLLLALHWQQVWEGIKQVFGQAGAFLLSGFRMLVDGVLDMVQGVLEAASHLPFIGSHFKAAYDSVKQFHADVDNTLTSLANDMANWGQQAGSGLAGGISRGLVASLPNVLGTTASVAASVAGAMRKGLAVQSPSRITMEIGRQVVRGLEVGMLGEQPAAAAVARSVLSVGDMTPDLGPAGTPAPAPAATAPFVLGGGGDLVLQLNNQEFARVTGPMLRTWLLRTQRNQSLGIKAS